MEAPSQVQKIRKENISIFVKIKVVAKQKDIKIKKANQGKFTAWAKKNMPKKSVCGAASSVMKNSKKYKPSVVKMANFAKNFGCSK